MIVVQDMQEVNGELVPMQPSPAHEWDGAKWVLVPAKAAAILEKQRADVALKISVWRDQQEAQPITFEHAGHSWDGGIKVKTRLDTVAALPALPEGYFWIDAANNDVPMTLSEVRQLREAHEIAIAQRGWEIHQRQRHMKTQVAMLEGDALLGFKPDW